MSAETIIEYATLPLRGKYPLQCLTANPKRLVFLVVVGGAHYRFDKERLFRRMRGRARYIAETFTTLIFVESVAERDWLTRQLRNMMTTGGTNHDCNITHPGANRHPASPRRATS